MMFLPDGRVLIMDNELFKKTIDQSIVLDILDQEGVSPSQTSAIIDVIQHHGARPANVLPINQFSQEVLEEEKQSMGGGAASRFYKDSNRKQSQANQKKRQPGDNEVNMSQQIDSMMINNQSVAGGQSAQGNLNDGD